MDIENLKRSPTYQFHTQGYLLPNYPTLPCTAIPKSAEDTLLHPTGTVLCYVRGLGDNYDSHNIVHPLVLDNIVAVTGLTLNDIFIVPTTIQAISPKTIDSLQVLVEENVLTVMYNPSTVSEDRFLSALKSLGLADSSQTIQLHLRGIPMEYISNPDIILSRPVPLNALEPINCIMIPMSTSSCGIALANLLLSTGTIQPENLLHLVVLPRNPHARYEYSHPRLYVFLTRGAQFRDSLASSTSAITALLSPELKGRKSFFKASHLPGIYALIQVTGTWARNKHLLKGAPLGDVATVVSQPNDTISHEENVSSCTTSSVHMESESQVTVMASVQQIIHQQAQYTTNQDLLLQNSYTMVAILQKLSDSLTANAPGSQGAVRNDV
jgi:hypothetical protein